MEFFDGIPLVFIDSPDHLINISFFELLNNPEQQIALAAEMGVQRSFGESHLFHDVVDGRAMVAGADKKVQRRLNDSSFCVFASLHLKKY